MRKHEQQKKREYNQRVMEIEHGTFTPLVYTISGALGRECHKFHKSLAEKVSVKKDEQYNDVIRYIRMNISFLVLKGTLLCLRGSRSVRRNVDVGEDIGQTLIDLGVSNC